MDNTQFYQGGYKQTSTDVLVKEAVGVPTTWPFGPTIPVIPWGPGGPGGPSSPDGPITPAIPCEGGVRSQMESADRQRFLFQQTHSRFVPERLEPRPSRLRPV